MSIWKDRAPEIQEMLDRDPPMSYGDMARHYNVARHTLRSKLQQLRNLGLIHYENRETHYDDYAKSENAHKAAVPVERDEIKEAIDKFGVQREIDGKTLTHKSTRLLELSETEDKDPAFLMTAHGYDPREWELVNSKSKIWNTYSKQDGVVTLYSSSITVKPKVTGWSFDDLLDAIRADVKPIHIETEITHVSDKRMLEIPFYDMHFGVSWYDHYKRTQRDTYDLLNSKHWGETLFIIGQDLLHNNDFSGKTANGTQIEVVDIPSAWKDAKMFYYTLIETAIRKSDAVKVIYSRGNHDEAMSWAFVQMLMERYPQVEFDDSLDERKVYTFGEIFLGITHGDTARKDLINLFPAEFPLQWAETTYREIHEGHLHREDSIDSFGVMSRTLATRNKTDKWHKKHGFTTAQKRFMLFEYTTDELKHIHYV